MSTNGESWFLLRQKENPADYNMALDEALLEFGQKLGKPVLRFYGWTEPAATFGYSQHYAEIERLTMLRPLIRRPTGGGLVPHDADWTYSLVFPAGHSWYRLKAVESYRRVHEWIRDAFTKIGVTTTLAPERIKDIPGQCFIGAEKDDVLWHGKKIAGAAQRRTDNGLLIQGSVQPPPIKVDHADWENAMAGVALEQFNLQWLSLDIGTELAKTIVDLQTHKYGQDSHNRKR